jgi:NADPH:quinone reductase-like Zn-dependent oxidoreductase
MNLSDIAAVATKPVAAFASVMNMPNSADRYRPFYFQNLVDAIAGKTLEDAVAGKIVVITGASSGIGESAARQIGAAGGEVVLVARTLENLERVAKRHPRRGWHRACLPVRPERPRRDLGHGRPGAGRLGPRRHPRQ